MESEFIQFEEPEVLYGTSDLLYKDDVFKIIGICMEIHRELGKGFDEVVYKDAMEYEFTMRGLTYEREKIFRIRYKDTFLKRTYNADFVYDSKIILEVKAQKNVINDHYRQTLNYIAASQLELGLIINFGEDSLKFKRVINN